MKITKENYEVLKAYVLKASKIVPINEHKAFIENEGKAKDINKRLRWDFGYFANKLYRQETGKDFICDVLYRENDLNDDHIDTALKNIFKDLT